MQQGRLINAGNCYEKGSAMKRAIIGMILTALLVSFAFALTGCSAEQMGETTAEGQRRHARVLRLDKQGMNEDLDAFFMLDKPSRLTERTIP